MIITVTLILLVWAYATSIIVYNFIKLKNEISKEEEKTTIQEIDRIINETLNEPYPYDNMR
jgi:hypothetical protein